MSSAQRDLGAQPVLRPWYAPAARLGLGRRAVATLAPHPNAHANQAKRTGNGVQPNWTSPN